MKKLLFFVIAAYLCYTLYDVYVDYQQDRLEADYETINQVVEELDYLITSGYLRKTAPNISISVVDLYSMYESPNPVFLKIKEDLGEDFPTNISNTDSIYISISAKERSYSVYVGKKSQQYMVYPEWKYPDLPAPTTPIIVTP